MKMQINKNNLIVGDDELEELKRTFAQNPVVLKDFWEPKTETFNLAKAPISSDDPNFDLAFKEWLIRTGYEIIEEDTAVSEEIKKLLAEFPDDNLEKIQILSKLPTMSRLKITATLEGLKKIKNEN